MTREELLVERITKITMSALGEELNNMLGIEVDKDFNEAILQASIKAAKVGMKFADEHPRWISVDDELPNNYEPVIAAFDRHFARVCFHCGDTWYLDNPPVAEPMSGITHWCPLPQPPSCPEIPNNCEKGGEE